MHWSTVSRAVLGLAGVVLVGYLLSRGVYVGSVTMLNSASGLLPVPDGRCHDWQKTFLITLRRQLCVPADAIDAPRWRISIVR